MPATPEHSSSASDLGGQDDHRQRWLAQQRAFGPLPVQTTSLPTTPDPSLQRPDRLYSATEISRNTAPDLGHDRDSDAEGDDDSSEWDAWSGSASDAVTDEILACWEARFTLAGWRVKLVGPATMTGMITARMAQLARA